MPTGPRFQIVSEFVAFEGWRNCLAVDRRESPARPVVLSFVPARVADAPERLARLAEDVERASRLFHANVLRVLGMGTFGDAPVVLQEWRDGESLRELLDTGSRMPPEVAARIVADAADAVHHSHFRAVEEGRPFAHGALRAERVLVGSDGAVIVSGFGRAAEGDGAAPTPAEDVRSLGALLLQCLAGEQPSGAGLPAVPDALARVRLVYARGRLLFPWRVWESDRNRREGAFNLAKENGLPLVVSVELLVLAMALWASGDLGRAKECAEEALRISQECNAKPCKSMAMVLRGCMVEEKPRPLSKKRSARLGMVFQY